MKVEEKYLNLLGLQAEDMITGMQGTITSISFDLYGCVQAILTPKVDRDGKFGDQEWFDVSRLATKVGSRVMALPNFGEAEILKGPESKPIPG